jgi:hypothetical protein
MLYSAQREKEIPTTTFTQLFDVLAITNTTSQREKAAGADTIDLRPIWLPTVDNLRCAKQSLVFLIG